MGIFSSLINIFILFKVVSLDVREGKEIYTTYGEGVLSTTKGTDLGVLAPCTHEETDTRLMVHALDATSRGHRRLRIRSNDTDVVVLAISVASTLQAVFQGGYVWGQTLLRQPVLPSPSDWGWQQQNNLWSPYWTALPQAKDTCYELIRCGCKASCRGRCKCMKANLACTGLCNCGGNCQQP